MDKPNIIRCMFCEVCDDNVYFMMQHMKEHNDKKVESENKAEAMKNKAVAKLPK